MERAVRDEDGEPGAQPPELIPPEALIRIVGSQTAEDYIATGRIFLSMFTRYGGLTPTDRVLDVGCGCGRMARPLTRYLMTGSYDGFDIVPELVAWCRDHITPAFPNFRFVQVDVANAFYHGAGADRARQFRFPYDDNAFDFTILASVFTHMLEDDVRRYAAEVTRTLNPGGTALMTFFLLNPESRRLMATPRSHFRFVYPAGRGIRVEDETQPEAAVAYPEDHARAILHGLGLEVQQILFGAWCGRENAPSGQDIVIVRRMSGGPDAPFMISHRLQRLGTRLRRWAARPVRR